jgi:hypothetical protein
VLRIASASNSTGCLCLAHRHDVDDCLRDPCCSCVCPTVCVQFYIVCAVLLCVWDSSVSLSNTSMYVSAITMRVCYPTTCV